MKLFLGSTNQKVDTAKSIASSLARSGYSVKRWWTSFRPGDVTIDRLLEIATEVDGAVFILDAADQAVSKDLKVVIPRDNLILEYGIFLRELGKQHCYLLVDTSCKLPSDIAGLTYSPLISDTNALAEEISRHFSTIGLCTRPPSYTKLTTPIICEESLLDIELGRLYNEKYRMRSVYLGTEGAKGWLDLISGTHYQFVAQKHAIKNSAISLLQESHFHFRTMVSLGPGDGEVERSIVQSSSSHLCNLFVPVDINEALLKITMRKVAPYVHVPFGLQCDFEDGFDFMQRVVTPLINETTLFVMMGNTFGNLDNPETTFLRNVLRLMQPGNHFLLEVAIRKSLEPAPYLTPITEEDTSTIHLLVNGLAYHTKQSPDSLKEELPIYLSRDTVQGLSDVDRTETVVYLASDKKPLAFWRRYSKDHLLSYLRANGLEVVSATTLPHNEKIENFIVLAKKPNNMLQQDPEPALRFQGR